MNAYELPTSLNIGGVSFSIRTDFRAIIDILIAQNDPNLNTYGKRLVMLKILYENWENIRRSMWKKPAGRLANLLTVDRRTMTRENLNHV